MQYSKNSGVRGGWVKGADVVSGSLCKLVSEAQPVEGEYGKRDVAKIRFKGEEGEAKNINLNSTTINGLIEAFGSDSKNWQGNILTAVTEKVIVGGKRVTAVYLVPDGFELMEDGNGYMNVVRKGSTTPKTAPGREEAPEDDIPVVGVDEQPANEADLPF